MKRDPTVPSEVDNPSPNLRKPFLFLIRLFGLIWIMNAGFQCSAWLLQPRGRGADNLIQAFAKPARDSPGWLQPYLLDVVHSVQIIGPRWVAVAMVAVAALLGISLLTRIGAQAMCWLGICYCLFCWTTLNSLGYPYTGGQTDPGVFIPYAISFVFILSILPMIIEKRSGSGQFPNTLWTTSRMLFGALWAFDAFLKWQPAFLYHFTDQLTSVVQGQPAWIAAYIGLVIVIINAVGPLAVAVLAALIETSIAVSVLTGSWMRLFVPVGLLWSLAVWSTAETFGGPYTSAGTGVRGNVLGNVVIYAIIFLFLAVPLCVGRSADES